MGIGTHHFPGMGRIHHVFLRLGFVRGVLVISGVSILASVLFTLFLLYREGLMVDRGMRNWSLVAAVVVPAVVATGVGIVTMNMLFRLRDAIARVAELASTDALTGMQTRRSFVEQAEPLLALARRRGVPVSLVLLDIDHFKQINDRYGHLAGDAVLVQAARLCREELRATDPAARYGGEEFVLMLTDCTVADAVAITERTRQRVELATIALPDTAQLRITLSAGVAIANHVDDMSLMRLLQRADDAMYRAKQAGRNRVYTDQAPARGED